MKNILKSILLLSGLALWVACEKDEEKAILNTDAKVVSELSASSVVLEKTQSNTTALTVKWETKNFNIRIVIPVQLLEKKHLEHTWLNFQKKQTVPSKY